MSMMIKNNKGAICVSKVGGQNKFVPQGGYRDYNFTQDEFEKIYTAWAVRNSMEDAEKELANVIAKRTNVTPGEAKQSAAAIIEDAMGKLIQFFKDFQFNPSMRFVNTMNLVLRKNKAEATAYIVNYFKLMDNPFAESIAEKVKSPEFQMILKSLADNATPTQTINKRLRVFYGPQGTGKTTEALKFTTSTIGCNASMMPTDLVRNFGFDDGKAAFHESPLRHAMENGETVILDEINLLPFDSLRFLQELCDNKPEITVDGETIKIKDGFNIVATMNLVVNGTTYGLPEPLVDRCSELREFFPTAKMLAGAI